MQHHHEEQSRRSELNDSPDTQWDSSLQIPPQMQELREEITAQAQHDDRPDWLKQAMTKVGLGIAGATIITGTFTTNPAHALQNQTSSPQRSPIPEEIHLKAAAVIPQNPDILANIIERSLPATVQIDTKTEIPNGTSTDVRHGFGSGFIIHEDGFIVTNHHVVGGAKEVGVTLISGERVLAKVVGTDPASDIALLKINASKKLPTLPLGDSDTLKQGEVVIALGNPMGLENTATVGIISSTHRSTFHVGLPNVIGYIQTDAAINPGNSGGALLNLKGQVIGINDAVLRDADNLGFALPISEAKRIISELKVDGQVDHAVIGVEAAPLNYRALESLRNDPKTAPLVNDLTPGYGAIVVRVRAGSPAQTAGLRPGDVLQEINGERIRDDGNLRKDIDAMKIGDSVKVKVIRNKTPITLTITLTERPGNAEPLLL